MEPQRIEQASSAAQMGNVLARTFKRLDSIGRGDLLTDARAYFDRAEELRTARVNAPARHDADKRAVLDDLVNGEVEIEQATTRMADIARAHDQAQTIPALLREAGDRATVLAWQSVKAHGDGLVHDLHDLVSQIVDESVTASEIIPSYVRDDETAIEEGAEVAGSWSLLKSLHHRWSVVHDMMDELRTNGALPDLECR